jgi:hypothetical protein
MKFHKSFTLSLLSSCLAFSGLSASRADTTETTQTTTTVTTSSNSSAFSLPSTGHYVVVDPITGEVQGGYDPVARVVDGGVLRSGYVIVNRTDGSAVGLIDASGNVVDVGVSPASQTLIVSIETRRQELNRRIDEALNKGVLTATQAAAFRLELERMASDGDADKVANGVITYRRALMLGYGLNTLSDRLVPVTHTVTFQPVIAPQFVVVNGRLTLLDKMDFRKHSLLTRCDDEYAAGRLSGQQVSRLKESLNKISADQARYSKNGALSTSKDRKLAVQMDRVQAQMDLNIASINQKRARIGIRAD